MANYSIDNLYGLDSLWGQDELAGQAAAGVARLLAQFSDSTELQKVVSIIGDRATTMLEVLGQVLIAHAIDTAQGDQLDAIGERLDLKRFSLDDETYRSILRIKAKLVLPSQGTAPLIYEVVRGLIDTGRDIQIYDYPPAQFLLIVYGITKVEADLLTPFIRDARAGGVGVNFGLGAIDALIVDDSQDPLAQTTRVASSQGAGTTLAGKVSSTISI